MFHHTLAVGRALADDGVEVIVHTAVDAEELGARLTICRCMHWHRRLPGGIRQAVTAARFVTRTVPHVVRAGASDDLVHVQGLFGNQLTAALIASLTRRRRNGAAVAFSPHNTFARSGRRFDDATIRWMARRAGVVIAFSDDDFRRVASWGATAMQAELAHFIPTPSAAERAEWDARFERRPVALLAGQVRADKRPDVFVEACAKAQVTAAVVGPAHDVEDLIRAACEDGTVVRVGGYLPLSSFVGAVVACDVVVATHGVGSVSGPLAFARELGVRAVAPAVGGLAESVTVAASGMSADDFAAAIREALARPAPAPIAPVSVAADHRAAYRAAGWVGA